MSDYFPARIEIGGALPTSELSNFLEAISQDGGHLLNSETNSGFRKYCRQFLLETSSIKDTLCLTNAKAHYGIFEHIECFCRQYNLSFRRQSDAHADFDGQVIRYDAEHTEITGCTQRGELYFTLQDLEDYLQLDGTLLQVVTNLRHFNDPIPPFQLVPGDQS